MMKLKVIHIILAFFLVYSSLCTAQKTESAAYTAGFRYYKTYDESRSYILNNDTISRPLLIHFWYPSHEITKTENLHFKDYVDLISLREDFNKASSEVSENSINFIDAYAGFAKQNFGLDTNISTQQILECPVSAQYGIDMAKTDERFPLIIYAPSNSKSAVQNHMICEYLASHGYMVISVGSAGAISLNRKNDQGSIMAQVEDMEYILKYFTDNLNLKYSGLGLFGFSSGGLATTIFQMRNKNVGAVFSMDGSQEYGHYTILSTVGDFNLKKNNSAILLFCQ